MLRDRDPLGALFGSYTALTETIGAPHFTAATVPVRIPCQDRNRTISTEIVKRNLSETEN